MSNVVAVTDQNFEAEVLNSDKPVLVDFWAEWCGPCKTLMPTVEALSAEMGDVKFVKVNIEDSPETPTKFGVRGIPTLILFKDGELVDATVGAQEKANLQNWIFEKV